MLTNDTALTVYIIVCLIVIAFCTVTAVIGTSKIVKDLAEAGRMIKALRNPTVEPSAKDN